jgi:hypothetical protein
MVCIYQTARYTIGLQKDASAARYGWKVNLHEPVKPQSSCFDSLCAGLDGHDKRGTGEHRPDIVLVMAQVG